MARRIKTLKDKIAESDLTLAFLGICTIIVWMWGEWSSLTQWASLGLTFLVVALIMEWNNRFQLLRIHTRFSSCVFLLTSLAFPQFHEPSVMLLLPLCFLLVNMLLMASYQDRESAGRTFYAFLFLSIGSTIWLPALFLVPFLWWAMSWNLRTFSLRTWMASIMGLVLPYAIVLLCWYYGIAYAAAYTTSFNGWHDYTSFTAIVQGVTMLSLDDFVLTAEFRTLVNYIGVLLLSLLVLTSFLHFKGVDYKDNIKTRQYLYTIVCQMLGLALWCCLFPGDTIGVLFVGSVLSAPLVAHYLALSENRMANCAFWLWLGVYACIFVFNRFNPAWLTIL